MKEIPILYSTPMVLAKLAGRKTVTRRTRGLNEINQEPDKWEAVRIWNGVAKFCEKHNWTNEQYIKTPFGQSGDILYGREKWYIVEREGMGIGAQFIIYEDEFYDGDLNENAPYRMVEKEYRWGCHPSIHLPKSVSRIWERVISVFPERLGDITEEDAVREGVEPYGDSGFYKDYLKQGDWVASAYASFISLWMSIHGPESWNPDLWVWRIETEVLSTTGRPVNL